MEIDGKTEKVGLIGHPVSHSFSPVMHNAAFEFLKMNYVYTAFDVKPESIREAVQGLSALGFKGVNVTVPHKESVIPFMDSLSDEAKIIGAVNTIKFSDEEIKGYNTDAYGFSAAIEKAFSIKLEGKKIFVIGAGGGAKAVATQSAIDGAKKITVTDISEGKAEQLTNNIRKNISSVQIEAVKTESREMKNAVEDADIIINATPLGMKDKDPIPIDTNLIGKGQKLFDLIYNPKETKLMKEAQMKGCEVSNGLMMLLYQGMKSFEIWTGIRPPEEVMKKKLESRVFGGK